MTAPAIPPTSNNVDNCALSAGLSVAKTSRTITEMSALNSTQQQGTSMEMLWLLHTVHSLIKTDVHLLTIAEPNKALGW
jgi:hypothetical protein